MKKAELEARIADLGEQAKKKKSEINTGLRLLEEAIKPKNIAKRAVFSMAAKVRSIFQFRKKVMRTGSRRKRIINSSGL
jgi:hypothetical protein